MADAAGQGRARVSVKTPEEFAIQTDQWQEWKRKFQRFRSVTYLDLDDNARQIETLLYVMGKVGDDIYNQLNLSDQVTPEDGDARDRTYEEVIQAFDRYFQPRSNYRHYRIQFGKRYQLPEENSETFVRELYALAAKCDFERASSKEDRIADQILAGMKDKDLSLELQIDSLGLNAIVDRIRAKEILAENQKSLDIDAVKFQRQPGSRQSQSSKEISKLIDCTYCGRKHAVRKCPAFGKLCNFCKGPNHFEKCCRKRASVAEVSEDNQVDSSYTVNFVIDSINSDTNLWHETVVLDHRKPVRFKVDTGAQVNLINSDELAQLPVHMYSSSVGLKSYTGNPIPVEGRVELWCSFKSVHRKCAFYVVKHRPSILGLKTLVDLGIVSKVDAVLKIEEVNKFQELLTGGKLDKTSSSLENVGSCEVQFKDLFSGGIGRLNTVHHICLKADARPVCAASRQVPQALRGKLQKELSRLVDQDIIEKVEIPSEWVHPIVVVDKPGTDRVRICLDPRALNEAILRERYTLPAPNEIFSRVGRSSFFTTLDATSGFYQIPLDEESQAITTFITPFGTYRFKRLPFGVSSAPEVFHKYMTQVLEGLEGVEVFIDDILVHGGSREEHDSRLRQVLSKLSQCGSKLNVAKCQIGKRSVTYLGHVLSDKGLSPMNSKVRAVEEMKVPSNKQELRRFLGFMNYLQKFCPRIADVEEPLRKLLRNNVLFTWEVAQQNAFEQCKQLVTKAPTLKLFEPSKPVTLAVDASGSCLGAVLMQGGRPIEYAAKSLNDVQQRYSPIEKELLAVVYGCKRFHYYLYGRKFQVQSDHKPLVGIVRKEIALVSRRLQGMVLQLQAYDFDLVHVPGKEMHVADALSRDVGVKGVVDEIALQELAMESELVFASEKTKIKYQSACENDLEQQCLRRYVLMGWPKNRQECGEAGRRYWQYRDDIHAEGVFLFYKNRWVVPLECRTVILEQLHKGHSGVSKTCAKAQSAVFWPGITRQLEELLLRCASCQESARMPAREPLMPSPVPRYPFEVVGADLCEIQGRHYLVLVDYYSKWVDVSEMVGGTKTQQVIDVIYKFIANFGIPRIIRSDNGPQFVNSLFAAFVKQLGIEHVTSSPRYPRSNGMVERHIQTVKGMMKKCLSEGSAWQIGLLALHNTPGVEGILSPAKLAQGRQLKESLPTLVKNLFPSSYGMKEMSDKLAHRQGVAAWYHDRTSGPTKPPLPADTSVRVRHNDSWIPGKVLKTVAPRSYEVVTSKGNLRRNRQHLIPTQVDLSSEIIRNRHIPPPPLSEQVNFENSDHTASEEPRVVSPPRESGSLQTTRSGRQVKRPAWHQDYVTN